ncbi:MAG: LapA family protein [Myxococcota bacterium]
MRIARRLIVLALFLGILVLGWKFAADHETGVVIRVPLSGDTEVSLWIALLTSFGLGVAVTGSLAALRLARQGLLSRRYRAIIRKLEAEIHELRNLPLTTEEPASDDAVFTADAPVPGRTLGRGA